MTKILKRLKAHITEDAFIEEYAESFDRTAKGDVKCQALTLMATNEIPTDSMMAKFQESRWRKSLPWCLLVVLGFFATLIPSITGSQIASVVLLLFLCLAAVVAARKLIFPRRVFAFEVDAILITGVIPGWWKLFQRWHTVRIPISDVISVRIGKIGKKGPLGLPVGPLGEPSRGGALQNFLWFHYRTGETQREIYYPHFNDIKSWPQLIENLRQVLGSKIVES